MRFSTILITLTLFLLFGCEQAKEQQKESHPPEIKSATEKAETVQQQSVGGNGSGLFHQPITPKLVELPSEALAYWRVNTAEKPALVLFSYDPLLKSIDPSLQEEARELTLTGSSKELRLHGSFNTAEPLILPTQAVAAALDAGLFSKLIWVFPSKADPALLQLEFFRNQMVEEQLLTEEDAAKLKLNDGIYSGEVRGIPFEAVHHQQLFKMEEPFVLHIELGFFRGLYDNEIKSPLYTLLRNTVEGIRQQNWQPLATTLSYSTLEGAVALDVRFVINDLAKLMRNPQLLNQEMPKEWQLRSEALYAGDMYSESKKIELSEQMVTVAPQSAAANFDRFQALFLDQKVEPALESLAKAVELDPGYAASYLELTQLAIQDGNFDKALELVTLAEQQLPENPFIGLQKAFLLSRSGQPRAALDQLDKAPQQWSTIYHPQVPAKIVELKKEITAESNEQKEE
ncbi:lipopolysaccharide assembly protein LapB [Malonomonas rubra]|uniref:tetratricopeptide repeat protein n=1 Tax=Malonomonas rubra TaxID=57040 RepID=UPI0026F05892|nr:tetratricopeptide repeat protein [Malonomonas rubra]